jgi:arylsulfatase A-like enzyme
MHRRDCLKLIGAGALSIRAGSAALSNRRPNIVFVLTDDQGYGDIACHGNTVIKTPNMDRLHAESVRFIDFHVSPTCSPTRTALMTGRHEFKSGVTHTINERERMSLKATTLAQALKSAGYTTGIFGKWHLGDAAPYQPNRRGFDETYIHGCGGIGQAYPGTCSDAPGNMYQNPTLMHNGKFEKTEGYCTDLFFTQGLKWIDEKRNAKTPFFAYITTNAPHVPLQCPERYRALYDGLDLDENAKKYFGMVTNIDDNLGVLLRKLKDWGMERDTLVIFMTDNGGTGGVKVFNAGMRGSKNTPYQGGTRVPAFFRWTGTLEPGDVDRLASHIDIFPTLAELTGAPLPQNVKLDGRSLVPLLSNHTASWPERYLFTHIGRWDKGKAAEAKHAKCRVRSARYSMVNSDGARKKWELYDLKSDPGEQQDIAAEHPDVVRAMDSAYDKWWDEVLPLLENENAVGPKTPPYQELYWKQFSERP